MTKERKPKGFRDVLLPATLEEVYKSRAIPPEGHHPYWTPVEHGFIVDEVKREISERNLVVRDDGWQLKLTSDGQIMSGHVLFDWESWNNLFPNTVPFGIIPRMGLLNSHNLKWAFRMTSCPVVQVCTNGLMLARGIIKLKRRHTGDIHTDVSAFVHVGMDTLIKETAKTPKLIDELKSTSVSPSQAAHIMLTLARWKALPYTMLPHVDAQWLSPSEDNCESEPHTAWRMQSAASYVMHRRFTPHREAEGLDALRRVIDAVAVRPNPAALV